MKYSIILLIPLFSFNLGRTQIKVCTPNGTPVILYTDGTWKCQIDTSKKTVVLVVDSTRKKDTIPTNPQVFQVSAFATHLVKSKVLNFLCRRVSS